MRKNMLKVSTISVLGALCAVLSTNAMAAGTVKSLGGAGTYNGTTAASSSTRSTPARAGSLRIAPASARIVTTTPSETTTGTTTSGGTNVRASGAQQRLSIGKYLGGAVTTAASATTGGSATAAAVSGLEDNINKIEDVFGKMQEGDTDGIIGIDDEGTISISLDTLKDKLVAEGLAETPDIEFDYDSESHELSWRAAGGSEWSKILDVDDLASATTLSELQTALGDLGDRVDALEDRVDTLESGTVSAALGGAPDEGVYVLGVVNGTQQMIRVVPGSNGNYGDDD